jgi:thioredoxin-dependent peroxiredoxin
LLPRVRAARFNTRIEARWSAAFCEGGLQSGCLVPRFTSMLQLPRAVGVLCLGWLSLTSCSRRAEPAAPAPQVLTVGARMPDLVGIDQWGQTHRLAESSGHPILVYFYPKDGTPGCTKEACAFRDVWQRFEQKGVTLYGVSRDDRASHQKFAEQHRITFALIADDAGKWATAFGVPNRNGRSARVSFLFDKRGRLARVYPEVDPGVHANQVLGDLEQLD